MPFSKQLLTGINDFSHNKKGSLARPFPLLSIVQLLIDKTTIIDVSRFTVGTKHTTGH